VGNLWRVCTALAPNVAENCSEFEFSYGLTLDINRKTEPVNDLRTQVPLVGFLRVVYNRS